MLKNSFRLLTLSAALAVLAGSAEAATMYGDFDGDTVRFKDVEGDSIFGAPSPSNPTIVADTLAMRPSEFEAQSSGVAPPVLVDGRLGMVVWAKPGNAIETVTIEESGGYRFLGSGTSASIVDASVIVSVNILEVDGEAFTGQSQIGFASTLFTTDLVTAGTAPGAWQEIVTFDIAEEAARQLDITGAITKVSFVLDNQLAAISEAASLSFIDKKNIDITFDTEPVIPEPASAALATLALLALGVARRR